MFLNYSFIESIIAYFTGFFVLHFTMPRLFFVLNKVESTSLGSSCSLKADLWIQRVLCSFM